MELPAIEHSVYINADIQKVFEILTAGKGWDAWFTNGTSIDLEKKQIIFVWKNLGVGHYNGESSGPIVSYERPYKFAFKWHDEPKTTATFTLKKHADGTLLSVVDKGYTDEKLPLYISCGIGWGEAFTMLKMYIEHGIVCKEVPK